MRNFAPFCRGHRTSEIFLKRPCNEADKEEEAIKNEEEETHQRSGGKHSVSQLSSVQ